MNFREKPDHVRQVVRERGYMAPVLLDESGDVTGKAYGVWGPPTAYFIDREGRLIGRVAGSRDWSGPAARAFIQALLDGSSSAAQAFQGLEAEGVSEPFTHHRRGDLYVLLRHVLALTCLQESRDASS